MIEVLNKPPGLKRETPSLKENNMKKTVILKPTKCEWCKKYREPGTRMVTEDELTWTCEDCSDVEDYD